jgi:5'-methylthioadenosine phosphorylase
VICIENRADIGVIGGTGFYTFLDDAEEVQVDTPYGFTSDAISLGVLAGSELRFYRDTARSTSIRHTW